MLFVHSDGRIYTHSMSILTALSDIRSVLLELRVGTLYVIFIYKLVRYVKIGHKIMYNGIEIELGTLPLHNLHFTSEDWRNLYKYT